MLRESRIIILCNHFSKLQTDEVTGSSKQAIENIKKCMSHFEALVNLVSES